MLEAFPVERRYWTAKEAAAYIGIHADTLRAYCRARTNNTKEARRMKVGSIPPFRIFGARTLRFPIEAFKEWADGVNLGPTRR